jgi:hypothetical protein
VSAVLLVCILGLVPLTQANADANQDRVSTRIFLRGHESDAGSPPARVKGAKDTSKGSVASALGSFMKGLVQKSGGAPKPHDSDWTDFISEQDIFDDIQTKEKPATPKKNFDFQMMIEQFSQEQPSVQTCAVHRADELMEFYRGGPLHWVVIIAAIVYTIVIAFHVRAIVMYRRHRAIQARSLMFSLLSAFAGTLCVLLIAVPHFIQDHVEKIAFLEGARFADMTLHLFALPLLTVPTTLRATRVVGLYTHENAKRNFAGKLPLGLLGIPTMDFRELEYQLLARKNTFFSKGPLYWSIGIIVLLAAYASVWSGLIMCKLTVKVEQIAITSHTLAIFLLQLMGVLALRNKDEAFSVKNEAATSTLLTLVLYVLQISFFLVLSKGGSEAFSFTWSGVYHCAILGIVVLGTICTVSWPLIACRAPDRQKMLRDPAQFKQILQHPTCRIYFTEYLASTFTSEYYLFWRDVEEFKLLKPESNLMAEAANLIYSVYVREGSAMDLHLNYVEQLNIRNQLNTVISPTIFDTSQAAILQRMGSLFPRFLDSSYARACNYDLVGRHLDKKPKEAV